MKKQIAIGKEIDIQIKAIQEAQHSIEVTIFNLQSNLAGLTINDAKSRLEYYGKNQVARERVPSAFIQLLLAFKNPFIFVLLVLASVSFFYGLLGANN